MILELTMEFDHDLFGLVQFLGLLLIFLGEFFVF